MPLVYVFRHGQASFGSGDYDKLSKTGVEQSKILGGFLKEAGFYFDEVYSGSLSRQEDTAFHTLSEMGDKKHEIKTLEGLNEYDHLKLIKAAIPYLQENLSDFPKDLSLLGKDKKEFQHFFSIMVEKWIEGRFLKSEILPYSEYSDHVLSSFETIAGEKKSKKKIAVFTSGGPISILLENTLGTNPFQAVGLGWGINNCSLSCLSSSGPFLRDKNRFRLRVFNSISHLELKKERSLITYR